MQFFIKKLYEDVYLKFLDLLSSYAIGVSEFSYWQTWFTPVLFTYSIGMSIFCQFAVFDFIY